jgi:hypothetical protein
LRPRQTFIIGFSEGLMKKKPTRQQMEKWWRDNHIEAAHGVPHDSSEGGYQYVFGGPEDPMVKLQEEFPDADLDVIKALSMDLNREGSWVNKDDY